MTAPLQCAFEALLLLKLHHYLASIQILFSCGHGQGESPVTD
jgi:hypothetical protein